MLLIPKLLFIQNYEPIHVHICSEFCLYIIFCIFTYHVSFYCEVGLYLCICVAIIYLSHYNLTTVHLRVCNWIYVLIKSEIITHFLFDNVSHISLSLFLYIFFFLVTPQEYFTAHLTLYSLKIVSSTNV